MERVVTEANNPTILNVSKWWKYSSYWVCITKSMRFFRETLDIVVGNYLYRFAES